MRAILPRLDHATRHDFDEVYEPSDDTYLLCDALFADQDLLLSRSPRVICEIGTGSGCVITYVHQLLENRQRSPGQKAVYYATDINPKALSLAQDTATINKECLLNGAVVDFVRTRFLNSMSLEGMVDVLIFNPPYVPTEDEEVDGSCGISASWAGGTDGRVVVDEFLPMIQILLRPGTGLCYLILVKENKPKDIIHRLSSQGLLVDVVASRRARNEHLLVLRISGRPDNATMVTRTH